MLEQDYDPVLVIICIYFPTGKNLFKVNNKDTATSTDIAQFF